jgi:hypothetical protein
MRRNRSTDQFCFDFFQSIFPLTPVYFGLTVKITERRRRCLEQDENAENTNQPPPPKAKLGQLQSQGFILNLV